MVRKVMKRLLTPFARQIGLVIPRLESLLASASLPLFANTPTHLRIDWPRRISHPQYMTLGDHIYLGPGSLLVAATEYPCEEMSIPTTSERQTFSPRLFIGNRVTATGNLTCVAHREIIIEDDVMLASNVSLTDAFHGFSRVDIPYKNQAMERISPIRIERGCWIGQNVLVAPGVTIGAFSIVGANSVVTRNIPPRCIAFGAPATVRKRWDEQNSTWIVVEQDSELQAVNSPEQAFPQR